MYERILIPLDGSKTGESALTHVKKLLSKLSPKVKTEITILQVISSLSYPIVAGDFSAAVPYTEKEIEKVIDLCQKDKARVALSEVYGKGGEGGTMLAEELLKAIDEEEHQFQLLYPDEMSLLDKIETVALQVYGASSVAMEGKIRRRILQIEKEGFGHLPVCIAKTQYSLSGDDEALGRPRDFTLIVTDASLSSGAGFVVIYCGDIMTMPGLPKIPAAVSIDITPEGDITGLK